MPSVLTACFAALALAPAPAPPASPLLGSWAVDVATLPVPPAARPREVTFTLADRADGNWSSVVRIVGPDGAVRAMTALVPPDGSQTVAISGDQLEADHVALKLVSPTVLVMALAKSGIPASTRIYTLDPDAKHMTETAVYLGEDGAAVMRTNHFTRRP
ncbi:MULTISPECIES: LuxR family transcriptional regulator [Sphingomonas]|uniref:LuxR family transcriptional regulator n=1 Tax=Sphingomonas TaxID=13687 RepID=UPI000DEF7F31|nr:MULTISPECIES: LuxR family transcriptional regulator [Sphingomonas]